VLDAAECGSRDRAHRVNIVWPFTPNHHTGTVGPSLTVVNAFACGSPTTSLDP
jgi:hypothetical protein